MSCLQAVRVHGCTWRLAQPLAQLCILAGQPLSPGLDLQQLLAAAGPPGSWPPCISVQVDRCAWSPSEQASVSKREHLRVFARAGLSPTRAEATASRVGRMRKPVPVRLRCSRALPGVPACPAGVRIMLQASAVQRVRMSPARAAPLPGPGVWPPAAWLPRCLTGGVEGSWNSGSKRLSRPSVLS